MPFFTFDQSIFKFTEKSEMGQERVYFIFFCGISFLSGLKRIYFVLKKFEIDLIFISALAKASYLWVTNYSTISHSSHQPSS